LHRCSRVVDVTDQQLIEVVGATFRMRRRDGRIDADLELSLIWPDGRLRLWKSDWVYQDVRFVLPTEGRTAAEALGDFAASTYDDYAADLEHDRVRFDREIGDIEIVWDIPDPIVQALGLRT
jgi:hypothetical protein